MECCQHHLAYEERFKNIEKQVDEINDQRERIAVIEQRSVFAHTRLDEMQKQTEAIIRMSVSVENIALQVKDMLQQFKEHDDRIDKLEKAPGEKVLGYWKSFIGAIISGIGGLLFGFMFKDKK